MASVTHTAFGAKQGSKASYRTLMAAQRRLG